MRDFKTLRVWERSHQLTLAVYNATASFPREEQYALTSQIRRACSSIPANVAEGCGRDGDRELARFLRIAMGSASELEYHLLLARDLGLLEPPIYDGLIKELLEIKRMLNVFLQTVRGQAEGKGGLTANS